MGEAKVTLNLDAAKALLKEARRDFENGASEHWRMGNEDQQPIIDATVEVIGRLAALVERRAEEPGAVEFTTTALEWMERNRGQQEAFVSELEEGESRGDPGYLPEQVYLLRVLTRACEQAKAVAV